MTSRCARRLLGAASIGLAAIGCGPAAPGPKPAPTVLVAPQPPASATPSAQAAKAGPEALLARLRKASGSQRQDLLGEIASQFGGGALVLALDTVAAEPPDKRFVQTAEIMTMLKGLADPRAADPLARWLETGKPSIHWMGEAATRLAELGDVRAAKHLGERLRHEPEAVYDPARHWEADAGGHLSRTDLPRVVAARMLSDLAVLHPDQRDALRAAAEDAVLSWISSRPQPHGNGLRFLAAVGSTSATGDLRTWAFPTAPLPALGQQPPFPAEFETAQTALRYIGWIRDEPSYPKLLAQLRRKTDRKLDITQQALTAGNAIFGMALRAVAFGASQGLEHWADPRAEKPLVAFIEDETWHEEARQTACEALAWCTDDPRLLVTKAREFAAKKGDAKQFIAACYAIGIAHRPRPEVVSDLVDLVAPAQSADVRSAAVRALAQLELDAAAVSRLEQKLSDRQVRVGAAIALLLGGTQPVSGVLSAIQGFDTRQQEELKDEVYRAFFAVATDDPSEALVGRWAARAEEAAGVEIGGRRATWVRDRLSAQLESLDFEAGPHTRTRVVLRFRLVRAARGGDPAARRRALLALSTLKERGSLAALAAEPGELGELAKKVLEAEPPPVAGD